MLGLVRVVGSPQDGSLLLRRRNHIRGVRDHSRGADPVEWCGLVPGRRDGACYSPFYVKPETLVLAGLGFRLFRVSAGGIVLY